MKVTLVLLLLTLLSSVFIFFHEKDLQKLDLEANFWQMAVLAYAAIKLFLVQTQPGTDKLIQRASARLAIATGIWCVGHVLITYSEILLHKTAYGTVADAFYLIGNSVCIYASAVFFHASLQNSPVAVRIRTTALLVLAVVSVLVVMMGPLLIDPQREWSWKALDVIYPCMDFLTTGFLLFSLRKASGEIRLFALLAAIAFFLIGSADVIFAYHTNFDSLLYRLVDGVYSTAYLFLAMAADTALQPQKKPA